MANNSTQALVPPQPDWIYPIATALGLLGVSIILANSFMIGFYQRKRREIVPLMYIMIALCDCVTGLTAICHAGMSTARKYQVTALLLEKAYPSADLFQTCLYVLFQSVTRTSLFYSAVLSVVRTINIMRPFYHIRNNVVMLFVIIYPITWIVIMVTDVCLISSKIGAVQTVTAVFALYPGMGLAMAWAGESNMIINYALVALLMGVPLVVPAIIALVCAVLQIYSVLKPSVISPSTAKYKRMTVTIIMLTVVCLACNVPYTIAYFHFLILSADGKISSITLAALLRLSYSLNTLLPFINAVLNPMILVGRGAALKRFLGDTVRSSFSQAASVFTLAEEVEMGVITNASAARK